MKKNVNRRGFFKLSYKEKQMVNNIMLKKEGKYTPFNLLFISIYIIMLVIFKENIIIYFFLLPLGYVVIRLRSYCYYNEHKEIDFDNDSKENNEMSKYTDNQTKLIVGFFVGIILFAIIGMFVGDFIDGNRNGNGSESCYSRDDGTKCCTACRKNEYGIPKCSTVCN